MLRLIPPGTADVDLADMILAADDAKSTLLAAIACRRASIAALDEALALLSEAVERDELAPAEAMELYESTVPRSS